MVRLKGQKNIVFIGLSILLLLFFYVESNEWSAGSFHRVKRLAQGIIAQDVILERDMNLLLQGRLSHYDTLTKVHTILNKNALALQKEVAKIGMFQRNMNDLAQAMSIQETSVEAFKTRLSLYRNSIRYVPILLGNTKAYYPWSSEIVYQSEQFLYQLLSQPAEFDKKSFAAFIKGISQPELKPLAVHLNGILNNYDAVMSVLIAIENCGIDAAIEGLSSNYVAWSKQEAKVAQRYHLLLIVFSGLLILYISAVVWRLKRSDDELRERNMFLHYLQKALDEHAIVTITDIDGNITFANDKFCSVSGFSEAEILGKNHRVLKSREHSQVFFDKLWETVSSGNPWRGLVKNKTKDGGYYWVDTSITPFLNKEGEVWQYVSVRTDMTKQIEIEQHLKESRERYRILLEMIPYALALVKGNEWVYVNKAAVTMFGGTSAKELLYKPIQQFMGEAEAKDLGQELQFTAQYQIPIPLQETKFQKHNGQAFDVALQGAPLQWDGELAVLLAMQDVTEKKREEREKKVYQEKLEHTQRLESLGVLAGGIAHDFNNILTSIMGNTALAVRHSEAPAELLKDLSKVNKASERAADLCEQMLMYSGGRELEKQPICLNELLNDVISMVQTTLKDQITLNVTVVENFKPIDADIRQIQQIVLNLLTNAAEAIEGSGTISAELGLTQVDSASPLDLINHKYLPNGEYVFLEVADTGCGMGDETLSKIFEPFYTTKFTGRGLGMSAILGIVNAHDGAISIQTACGAGTKIRVYFPASSKEVPKKLAVDEPVHSGVMSGQILLIDDESGIIEFVAEVLSEEGFEIVTAEDGEAGIAQYEKYKFTLALVVCDMVMPKLGGVEVAKYIEQDGLGVPVLLSSGYDEDALAKKDIQGVDGFIHKPFMPVALIEAVSQIINKS